MSGLTDEQRAELGNAAADMDLGTWHEGRLFTKVERIVAEAVEAAMADEGRIMLRPCPSCGELAATWAGPNCSACVRVEAAERALVERLRSELDDVDTDAMWKPAFLAGWRQGMTDADSVLRVALARPDAEVTP